MDGQPQSQQPGQQPNPINEYVFMIGELYVSKRMVEEKWHDTELQRSQLAGKIEELMQKNEDLQKTVTDLKGKMERRQGRSKREELSESATEGRS